MFSALTCGALCVALVLWGLSTESKEPKTMYHLRGASICMLSIGFVLSAIGTIQFLTTLT